MTVCRLVAVAGPRPSITLSFEFVNDGDEPWSGTVFEPAIPWDLVARAGGDEVDIRQPPLDVMARARAIDLSPGESAEVRSPVVLVFEDDPDLPDDPFVWVLGTTSPVELELRASIGGPGESYRADAAAVSV